MIALPIGMRYEDWFIQLVQDQPQLMDVPIRPSEEHWVEDVQLLLRNEQCALLNSPRPETFDNWQAWADSFIRSYGGLV